MKYLDEASYVLGIQILRDRRNRSINLSQAAYIDKVLVKYAMEVSKKRSLPFQHGITLSKDQSPKTLEEEEHIKRVSCASAVGSH